MNSSLWLAAALALLLGCEVQKIPDNNPSLPVKPELIGEAYSTKVYRFSDQGRLCFVAIERSKAGVAISCLTEQP